MKAKIDLELQPFTTPNFVRLAIDNGDATKEGYPTPIKDLDAETLGRLCDQFREDVFEKANKRDPAKDRPRLRELKAKSIKDKAHEYMERANKRFRAKHKHKNPNEAAHCEFCNGHSWGAVDGYIAGYKAAKRR